MRPAELDLLLRRVATLDDPVRRAVYFFVVEQGESSRDQAARGVHISRALAAFHLDKLVQQQLLEARYRRLNRRRGPGAGRPAKLYRRAALQLALYLPWREYELAARLFAGVLAAERRPALTRLRRAARDLGRRLGKDAPRGRRAFITLLRHYGYEPVRRGTGAIALRNCPFDALARLNRDLVCGMNRALLSGLQRGAGLAGHKVVPCTEPQMCCAMLEPTSRQRTSRG